MKTKTTNMRQKCKKIGDAWLITEFAEHKIVAYFLKSSNILTFDLLMNRTYNLAMFFVF